MPSPAVISDTPRRETLPPDLRLWINEEVADRFQEAEAQFQDWLKALGKMEALFAKHVYRNDDATQLDFRQHRQCLYASLARGEALAVDFETLGESAGAPKYVELIDEKLEALRAVLREWHGPADDPALPQSCRQGFFEARNGIGLEELEG